MKQIPYFDLIILKLGNSCNFQCVHCSQGTVPKCDLSDNVSQDVIDFLDEYVKAHKDKKKTLVKIYGGEPLVYFHHLKFIVERYRDKFDYFINTNGALLTEVIVGFANKYDIKVVLSHDGENTKSVRRVDVLKDERINRLFAAISKKQFLTCISSVTPRIDTVFDYFKTLHYGEVPNSFVWIIDHDGTKEQIALSNIDFDKYREGIQEVIRRFEEHRTGRGYFPREYDFVRGRFSKIENAKKRSFDPIDYVSKCNTCGFAKGERKLAIDVQGNVYECHNGNNIIGTVKDEYEELRQRDHECKRKIKKNLPCKDCSFSDFCEGVCSNGTPLADEVWCTISKITFSEIIAYLTRKAEGIL